MNVPWSQKILTPPELIEKVRALRQAGKVVVQSHGIFDLIHPGIIQHLDAARKMGDVLIVTIIRDENVHRGPGRPVFTGELRAQNVAALAQVDFVCLIGEEEPFSCVRQIQPDIFAKGQAYDQRNRAMHEKIFEQERELYFGKCRIMETEGLRFTHAHVLDRLADVFPAETRPFLAEFRKRHSFAQIKDAFEALKKLKVLVVGDGIIDEYHYCQSLGKAAKANLVVSRYLSHEVFAGGAFVVANHAAGLVGQVQLVSLLGERERREDFVRGELRKNVQAAFFTKPDSPTIVKKRYLEDYSKQKLFEVCYLNDSPIGGDVERQVIEHLRSEIPRHDLVMISDFGHGLVTPAVLETVSSLAGRWAANAQTNAANRGYNLITKYNGPDYVCVDETELRLAGQAKHEPIDEVARRVARQTKAGRLICTLGKSGSVAVEGDSPAIRTPILCNKVVDTIGAGDAFFACTAPCCVGGMPLDALAFIGNAAGAIAVQTVGNKKPVERHELLEFIQALLA